ncbi:unnamed protein product [Musa textilis]
MEKSVPQRLRLAEAGGDGDDYNQNDQEEQDDADAEPLAAAPLVLLGALELPGAVLDVVGGAGDVVLDVVHLLPLGLHHHRHVQEHLVQLQQAALHLLGRVVPVLDLVYRGQHLPPPVLQHRLLHHPLALPVGDDPLDHLLLGGLPRHREVAPLHRLPVLRHHPLPQRLELHHQLLELYPQAVGDRGPGPVDGSALAAARQPPVGRVGPVHGLEPAADTTGRLEYPDDVGIDAIAEAAESLRLVEGLALLVGSLEPSEQVSDGGHLLLDEPGFLEEVPEVTVGVASGHLDRDVVGCAGLQVLEGLFLEVGVAEEGFGH